MAISAHEDVELSSTSVVDTRPATFIAHADNITIGNNKSMISILNADASKIVRIHQIIVVNNQTTAVTGIMSEFTVLRITGHSAGTSITPLSYDTTDSLDADITVRTGSTVSGEGTLSYKKWKQSSDEYGVGATDVESFDAAIQRVFAMYERGSQLKPITLRQNEGITVKHIFNSTAGSFSLYLVFTQEDT